MHYTIYDFQDNIIACGNSTECAKMLNVKIGTFYAILKRIRNNKCTYSAVIGKKDGDLSSYESNSGKTKAERLLNKQKATELRKRGYKIQEISKQLDISVTTAWKYVKNIRKGVS